MLRTRFLLLPDCAQMARSAGHRGLAALVLLGVLAVAGFGPPLGSASSHEIHAATAPGQVLATSVHPFATGATQTTNGSVPLLELFTATWCPPCAPADHAVDRLLREDSAARAAVNQSLAPQLAVLAYHPVPDPGAEDPFGIPAGMTRMERKYEAFWFPSMYVNGVFEDAATTRSMDVDAAMEEATYNGYKKLIRQANAIPYLFGLTTNLSFENGTMSVVARMSAHAHVDDPLYVQIAIWEDHLAFPGSNGVDEHRMVVRALLDRQYKPDGAQPGDEWLARWDVVLPKGINLDNAGVTVFVETAWEFTPKDQAGAMMSFALASSAAVGVAVFAATRKGRKPPTESSRGTKQ